MNEPEPSSRAAGIGGRLAALRRGQTLWSAAEILALAVAALYLVWISGCMLAGMERPWDDNFMTYIYSRNLAQGHGLRYNAVDPEPTEGFSSLSHVVLVALTDNLGLDPLLASRAFSLVFFLLTPLAIGWPLSRLLGVPARTVLAVACGAQILYFLSIHVVFHLQAGMETVIFMGSLACLAGWSLGELTPAPAPAPEDASAPPRIARRVLHGSLVMALAIASRPEGPILALLTLGLVFVARRYLLPELRARNDRGFLIVSAVTTAGILVYSIWKWWYFGYLMPNPYYMKAHNAIYGSRGVLLPGWDDTRAFARWILPWAAAGIPLYALARGNRGAKRALLISAIPAAILVLAYAKAIHEAAAYHRYEFPYLVYLYLPLVGLAALLAGRFRLLPLLLVPSCIIWVQYFSFPWSSAALSPTRWLHRGVDQKGDAWVRPGRDLAETGLGQRATIAVGAAGAIPYLSGFRAIDLAGLNNNYLSGRFPRTSEEIWGYIDSFKPDVYQSGTPPASPGIGADQYDPVSARYYALREASGDTGSGVERYWDREKVRKMRRLEMVYLRDHYVFGAAYRVTDSEFILLYVRRDSPFRERILQTLRNSPRPDRRSRLDLLYGTDIRNR